MRKSDWDDDELLDLDEDDGAYDDEDDYDYEEDDDGDGNALTAVSARLLIPMAVAAVLLLAVVIAAIVLTGRKKETPVVVQTQEESAGEQEVQALPDVEPDQEENNITDVTDSADAEGEPTDSETEESEDAQEDQEEEVQDPQAASMNEAQGAEVDVTEILASDRVTVTDQVTVGIDVARYQGTIDWAQVAASGIDFAMVRVGYRTNGSREICADTNARYNMQEAQKNGIKVGAYFFSTAATADEAKEEADWVADYISGYRITYPVAYDCEGFDKEGSAQYGLTNAQRTDIALAFLQEINNRGYTPMFYASMGELSNSAKWDTARIENTYGIWVSQYPGAPYPETGESSYAGTHAMWQYTNRGTVPGITTPVDVNVAYFGYEGTAEAVSAETPEEVQADKEALMNFSEVNETVTAKDSTNLRDVPSQGADSTVVYTLKNGETVTRTGVSDSGWSRLTYNGQTVYAVSNYLTTDLQYQAPAQEGAESGDGLKTKFAERNEQVTAKIEVNLRALPSVTNPDAAVVAVLHNGEYVTRTGINEDYGWSRVDYNGQTLYCISSYLTN